MFAEFVYDRLTSDSRVVAIVGNRVYPVVRPKRSPLPAITFRTVQGNPYLAMGGVGPEFDAVIEVNCLSQTYEEGDRLARLLYGEGKGDGVLEGFCGQSKLWYIDFIVLVGYRELQEPDTDTYQFGGDYQVTGKYNG